MNKRIYLQNLMKLGIVYYYRGWNIKIPHITRIKIIISYILYFNQVNFGYNIICINVKKIFKLGFYQWYIIIIVHVFGLALVENNLLTKQKQIVTNTFFA